MSIALQTSPWFARNTHVEGPSLNRSAGPISIRRSLTLNNRRFEFLEKTVKAIEDATAR